MKRLAFALVVSAGCQPAPKPVEPAPTPAATACTTGWSVVVQKTQKFGKHEIRIDCDDSKGRLRQTWWSSPGGMEQDPPKPLNPNDWNRLWTAIESASWREITKKCRGKGIPEVVSGLEVTITVGEDRREYRCHSQTADGALATIVDAVYAARDSTVAEPQTTTPAFPGPLVVTFVDIGQGDAILVDAGDAEALIDTGPNGHWDGELKVALEEAVDGALEFLFLTHPHEDHVAQADEVLGMLDVQRVITNGEGSAPREDKAPKYGGEYLAALKAEGLEAEPAVVDESYELVPGVVFEVYSTGGYGDNINDNSLVMMLTYAGRKVLLPAEIEVAAGERLVRDYCGPEGGMCPALKSDVLKVPHHGSAHFSQEFFDRVQPSYAVISAGFWSTRHCLPRDASYQALAVLGAKIFSTSADGTANVTVTISSDGNMEWDYPEQPVFVWEGMKSGYRVSGIIAKLPASSLSVTKTRSGAATKSKSKTRSMGLCTGPLVYHQGTPRPYVAE